MPCRQFCGSAAQITYQLYQQLPLTVETHYAVLYHDGLKLHADSPRMPARPQPGLSGFAAAVVPGLALRGIGQPVAATAFPANRAASVNLNFFALRGRWQLDGWPLVLRLCGRGCWPLLL
jgi:hypothetical protein